MRIGVPKEVKVEEYRVGLTPSSVAQLVADGHDVTVEASAGAEIDFPDEAYVAAGASVAPTADDVFANSELIVKVKEPQPAETARLQPNHILFTYLHLAADAGLARGLVDSGATCIAYETVTDTAGGLPLLRPMSEVAGRMSAQVGARFLERPQGGRGVLMGGVPGVSRARVVVLGGGVAGVNAARIAHGMNADVTIFDISPLRLAQIDEAFDGQIKTAHSTPVLIEDAIAEADLVIGAVLVPGDEAPKLIRRDQLKLMKPRSVLVDIAIDQGGCFETSRPTTHKEPVFEVDGVVHYCVANMPGAVPRTSTIALSAVTLPFVRRLAASGRAALDEDAHLARGANVVNGKVVHAGVARALPALA